MIFICMTSEVVWQCDKPSQVGRLQKYNALSHTLSNTYIFKVIDINLLCAIKICRLPISKKSNIFALCNTLYNSINGNYLCDMHLCLGFRIQCNYCRQKNIFSSSHAATALYS